MPKPKLTLVTVDYPPQAGGVARYLANLVAASHGAIRVCDAQPLFRTGWPCWWPLVRELRALPRGETVLVSHVLPLGTAAWLARCLMGPRYVVLFHGTDLRRIDSAWKRWLLRRICHSAKKLFCNSEWTRQLLYSLVPGVEATLLTPGVEERLVDSREVARQKLSLDPEKKIVLSIARLIPRKGIDVALEAMGRIQHMQDVEYVVLGDGADLDRLRSVAERSRTRMRWIRSADDQEKWLWLAAADVFVLPARDEGNDVEGFGIVFLEAAKAGIPSVAGKSGGASEAVRHGFTGLVVKPGSVDEVEGALQKLLDDDALRQQFGDAAKQRVEKDFRWEDRWKTLSNLL